MNAPLRESLVAAALEALSPADRARFHRETRDFIDLLRLALRARAAGAVVSVAGVPLAEHWRRQAERRERQEDATAAVWRAHAESLQLVDQVRAIVAANADGDAC